MKSVILWQKRLSTNVRQKNTSPTKLQDPILLRPSTYHQDSMVTIQHRNLISPSDHHSSTHAISGSKMPCFQQLKTPSRATPPVASSMSLVSERQAMGPTLAHNDPLPLPRA
jgi:hypothetical protein